MKRILSVAVIVALLSPAPALAQVFTGAARTAGVLAGAPVVVPQTTLGASLTTPSLSLTPLSSVPSPVLSAVTVSPKAAPAAMGAQAASPARALAAPLAAASAALPQARPVAAKAVLTVVRESVARDNVVSFHKKSGEGAAAASGALFDNLRVRDGNGVRMPALVTAPVSWSARLARRALAVSPLGRLLPAETAQRWGRAPPAPKHELSADDFGGPPALKAVPAEGGRLGRAYARFKRDLGYGAKWAMTLFGISSLLEITVKPLAAALPWQLWLSDETLKVLGRVELLKDFGPGTIAEAVAQAPLPFLALAVPGAVLAEELTYRLLNFGITFGLLAAIRPAANGVAAFLDKVPDLFGLRSAAQWALRKVAGISSRSFSIAAALSAVSFAAAHFAAWGVAPYTLAVHLTLGTALAWVAYRSRGLTAPVTAHLGYNLLAIAVGVAAPLYLLPQTASLVGVLAGILGGSFVYYQWRSWKKDKAESLAAALGRTRPAPSGWAKARRWLLALFIPVMLALPFVYRASFPEPRAVGRPPAALTTPVIAPTLHGGGPAPAAVLRPTLSTEDLVKAVKPAVVMVRTPTGSGSGFIISPDGLLVSNAHVVAGGASENHLSKDYAPFVKIRFANGREVPAKVVGYHAAKDLALIQLPPNPFGWPYVPLGDSNALNDGQDVVAIGYPRGLPFSVSRGVVSGKDFRNNGWVSYIQSDAAVNPGNSGGPLFNMRGEVVGVNSMIMTESGGFDGITYSITAADVQKALDQYAKVGNISAAWLGVIVQRNAAADSEFGVRVDAVRPGSPAAAAGLRAGDVLIGIAGSSVAGDPDQALKALALTLRAKIPGEKLQLQVYRAGGVVDVEIPLGVK